MAENNPALKLADQSGSDKPQTKSTATPTGAPAADQPKPERQLRQPGKPKFNEDDVCQYNGGLVVVIGRAKEIVAEGDAQALVWRYLVNLPDADGRCPYLVSAGSWAPEASLKSLEECTAELKESVTALRL